VAAKGRSPAIRQPAGAARHGKVRVAQANP
jgi:hypothetical protein